MYLTDPKEAICMGNMIHWQLQAKTFILLIDADLQEYGEMLMKNKTGSFVALDPKTGEILTIVSSPAYDPNLLVGRERTKTILCLKKMKQNLYSTGHLMAKYPPGSTFKLVDALIGQQEGVLFPETKYSCERGFHFGGLTVGMPCSSFSSRFTGFYRNFL